MRGGLLILSIIISATIAQFNISTFTSCPIYDGFWTPLYFGQPTDSITISRCAKMTYLYNYTDSNSPTIQTSIHAYLPTSSSLGSIILLGDSNIGNSGPGIERIGYAIYMTLQRRFAVYMPMFRGTDLRGFNFFTCGAYGNYDLLGFENCQDKRTSNGLLFGFSVDNMALDLINLRNFLKTSQPNTSITFFGRSFGSYVVNRALTIDPTSADSVILESAWGPHTNASDWDVQRDLISKSILKQFDTKPTPEYSSKTQTSSLSSFQKTSYNIKSDIAVCGKLVSAQTKLKWKSTAALALFNEALRPRFMASLSQFDKCSYSDFGSASSLFDNNITYTSDSTKTDGKSAEFFFNRAVYEVDSILVTNHVLTSELVDMSKISVNFDLDASFDLHASVRTLLNAGWIPYPQSTYRNKIANYTGHVLVLNGEFDPQSTVESAKNFSSQFPNSRFYMMPGVVNNAIVDLNHWGDVTCGANLVQQFLLCPNCSINSTCISGMSMGFNGDPFTRIFYGNDVWKSVYYPPTSPYLAYCIVFGITAIVPVVVIFGLLLFIRKRIVQSRGVAPYVGLLFIFVNVLISSFTYGSEFVSLPYIGIGFIIQQSLFVCSALMMILQTVRFYALTIMYRNMSKRVPSGKLMLVLGSKVLMATLFAITMLLWIIFGVIMYVLSFYYSYNFTVSVYSYCTLGR
ncbi:hypothetical protein AKO1_012755 [Acrasis kona]|uniref:Uncharacterized protein n=1 Tax=Acrasis kona TaxID=1008807 RepID=A0AAW2YWW5_9EUKA